MHTLTVSFNNTSNITRTFLSRNAVVEVVVETKCMKVPGFLVALCASFLISVREALSFGLVNVHRSQSLKMYSRRDEGGASIINPSIMENHETLVARIDTALSHGHKICLIARGLPGRGKTTLVGNIVEHFNKKKVFQAIMVAADDFMMNSKGMCQLGEIVEGVSLHV